MACEGRWITYDPALNLIYYVTAYNINDGRMVWRAYGTGPDKDVLIDPDKTLMMGKPIGKVDLGVTTWRADQWQHGGASAWGIEPWDLGSQSAAGRQ
jgi:lanthanide-dependent methanol dehydrogenase